MSLILVTHGSAQSEPASTPQAVIKVRTELVTVPVVVTDKSGAHVHGLKKEDFVLREDGKTQSITSFEEILPSVPQAPLKPPNHFSNVIAAGAAPIPVMILVFDLVNTPLEDQDYGRTQLIRYLNESKDRKQLLSLFAITRNGVKLLQDFTSDSSAVISALNGMKQERNLVEQASQEKIVTDSMLAPMMMRQIASEQMLESVERRSAIEITLLSLQQVAQLCSGLAGRKALLWATAGFPFTLDELNMSMSITNVRGESLGSVRNLYEKTWQLLNQAEVSVYPVDVRGMINPAAPDILIQNPNPGFAEHALAVQSDTVGTFRIIANATGGRAFFNTNDLNTAFQTAADDNSSYYLLSYYLARANKKIGWHKLEVNIPREKVQIRARSGFFVRPNSQDTGASEMQAALASPLAYTGIQITGQWMQTMPSSEPGKKKIIFLLNMPAKFAEIDASNNNHMLLRFVADVRTATGQAAGEFPKTMDGHLNVVSAEQIRTHGMDYRGDLILPPGEYTVHFAVQDLLGGRLGSVSTPLKVEP